MSRHQALIGFSIALIISVVSQSKPQSSSQVPDNDNQRLETIARLWGQSYEFTQQGKYEEGLAPAERR